MVGSEASLILFFKMSLSLEVSGRLLLQYWLANFRVL